MKKQYNISRTIDAVVAGQIPAEVLRAEVEKESSFLSPLMEPIGNVAAVAIGLWIFKEFAWPAIKARL